MNFPNIDFPTSRGETKPLLGVVEPLLQATCAGRSATDLFTAISSACSYQITVDLVYALCALCLVIRMVKVLRPIHLSLPTEMAVVVAARLVMDQIQIPMVDTLVLLLMVGIVVVLLAVLLVAVAVTARVEILAETQARDATCTATTKRTERDLQGGRVVLVTLAVEMVMDACLAIEHALGTAVEGDVAYGSPTKACRVTVAIMGATRQGGTRLTHLPWLIHPHRPLL